MKAVLFALALLVKGGGAAECVIGSNADVIIAADCEVSASATFTPSTLTVNDGITITFSGPSTSQRLR